MRINRLPKELLEPILHDVSLNAADLAGLARSCRGLHSPATVQLYSAIDLSCTATSSFPRLKLPVHLLVRTCTENAELASLITSLSVKGKQSFWFSSRESKYLPLWPKDARPLLSSEELAVVCQSTHGLEALRDRSWAQDLQEGNVNAYLAVLLLTLPNIESLTLDQDFYRNSPHLIKALKARCPYHIDSASPQEAFLKLKSVQLLPADVWTTDRVVDPALTTLLLYLPSIEQITSAMISLPPFKWPHQRSPSCLTLVSLDLPECEMDEKSLGRLLAKTPSLRKLRYDRHIDLDPTSPYQPENLSEWEWFDLPALRKAIAPIQSQLIELRLGVFFFANTALDVGMDVRWGVKPAFGGFAEFTQLEELEVPFVVFPGQKVDGGDRVLEPEALPPALKTLRFRNDMAEHDSYLFESIVALKWVETFLEQKGLYAPNLEELGLLVGENREYEWDEDEKTHLQQLCALSGLRCIIDEDQTRS